MSDGQTRGDPEIDELRAGVRAAAAARDREAWALAQFRLGTAYLERLVWGVQADARPAIRALRRALRVWDPGTAWAKWSMAAFNLGTAYLQRPDGPRSASIEAAIRWYRRALRATPREVWPAQWANAADGLGQAYRQRIHGSPARNHERALGWFRRALRERPADDDVVAHAKTRLNIANALLSRVRGDPTENVQRAIRQLRAALAVLRAYADGSPEHARTRALLHQALGLAYADHPVGEPEGDRRAALAHLERAVELRAREEVPHRWADAVINLGSVCVGERFRATRRRAADAERAIRCGVAALGVLRRDEQPDRWATAHHVLARAFLERTAGRPDENVRCAIRHLRLSLRVWTRDADPLQWAEATQQLAGAYTRLPDDPRAARRAVDGYQRALEVFTDDLPVQHRRTLRNVAHLHYERQQWPRAVDAYRHAMRASVALLGDAFTPGGRRAEAAELSRMVPLAAHALLRMGRLARGLEMMEDGKARLMAEALASGEPGGRDAVRALEAELATHDPLEDAPRARRLRERLHAARAALRAAAARRPPPGTRLRAREILQLAGPGECLVAPLLTPYGCAVFILPHGTRRIRPDDVPWIDTGNLFARLRPGQVWRPDATDRERTWLQDFVHWRAGTAERARPAWEAALDKLLKRLWALMGPVCARLRGTGTHTLVILPQGGLQLLPLHAAWTEENGVRRYVLDEFRVRYAPSAYVLRECLARAAERGPGEVLAAAVGRYGDPRLRPLRFAVPEALGVARASGARVLLDRDATAAAVLAQAGGVSHLHLSCHATTAADPLDAALQLGGRGPGGRDRLPAWRILGEADLARARLVTLAACESGVVDHLLAPDEYVGMPGALLQAGSAGVISSLWAVHDLACALLWPRFYQAHLGGGLPPDAALRESALWLRDLTPAGLREVAEEWRAAGVPEANSLDAVAAHAEAGGQRPFSHPSLWAAFTLSGA
jgi:CHAT domain-containing protein/tetratricopeptide (TPR) repeat protein